MALHSWDLQKAIYSTLNGSVTGMGGASVSVYDDIPGEYVISVCCDQ